MEKINGRTSEIIKLSRFPLAILVVFIHSVGDLDAPYAHLRDFISHPLLSFVVPTFYIMSGYLFFWNINDKTCLEWYYDKLQRRIKKLLIPYVVWNLVTLGLDYTKYLKRSVCWLPYQEMTVGDILYRTLFAYQPIDLPLWYVRDLIVLIIMSPVIYYIVSQKTCCVFIFTISVWYFCGGNILVNPVSVLFFTIGGLLGIKKMDLILFREKMHINILFLLTMLLIVFMYLDINFIVSKIYAILMPFVFFYMISYCISKKWGALSKYSEIIYYSHYPITLIVSITLVSKILPTYSLVNYFTIPLLAVILSIGMKMIFDKIKSLIYDINNSSSI